MRPRTSNFLWIPFVFSIGTISWGLLIVGLALFSAVLLTPSIRDLREARVERNDYQATLDLLDQRIALQKEFLEAAKTDPVLMQCLAERLLNVGRPGEEPLPPLTPQAQAIDHSVETLLAGSLKPVTPAAVAPVPAPLEGTLQPYVHRMLIAVACVALALSFFLGVRYARE